MAQESAEKSVTPTSPLEAPPGPKRRALLADGKADGGAAAPQAEPRVTGVPGYRPLNVKRSTHAQRLFLLSLIIVLVMMAGIVVAAYTFYLSEIKPSLALIQMNARRASVETVTEPDQETATAVGEGETALKSVSELQKQLDGVRESLAAQESQLTRLNDRLVSQKSSAASISTIESAGIQAPKLDVPSVMEASPTAKELVLLKERNRLTHYADEAIATGARGPLDRIVASMKNPDLSHLWFAAKAEYYRVMSHYQFVTRIDPTFRLPIDELFAEEGLRGESDLTTEQIVQLLANKELEWQVRLRCAYLLGGRRSSDVSAALLTAILEDPNLDVAKEAQLSFEQNMGRRFLLFDNEAIQTWWGEQAELAGEE